MAIIYHLKGWGQIDEHCWSNNVGWQKLNHLTSHLNNVETCVINMITQNLYFGFCQTFQPNKCVCVMTFTETDLSQTSNSSDSWTQKAIKMAAPWWKLLWGWYISGFKLTEDRAWAKVIQSSSTKFWSYGGHAWNILTVIFRITLTYQSWSLLLLFSGWHIRD